MVFFITFLPTFTRLLPIDEIKDYIIDFFTNMLSSTQMYLDKLSEDNNKNTFTRICLSPFQLIIDLNAVYNCRSYRLGSLKCFLSF